MIRLALALALMLAALPVCRGWGKAYICNDARGQVAVCCMKGT